MLGLRATHLHDEVGKDQASPCLSAALPAEGSHSVRLEDGVENGIITGGNARVSMVVGFV
jgi:hypothetical protein